VTTTRKPPAGWKKGQSGNPAGRKPGTGEVAKIRAAIAKQVPAIIEQLTTAALAGDVGAARLLLERTVAPLKATEPTVAVDMAGQTLTDQGRAVLAAVAAGHVAPGQGASLVAAIGTLARVTELDELSARVAALEARPTGGDARGAAMPPTTSQAPTARKKEK
jgi:hypothetical protein